jgi:hypothetical protein
MLLSPKKLQGFKIYLTVHFYCAVVSKIKTYQQKWE